MSTELESSPTTKEFHQCIIYSHIWVSYADKPIRKALDELSDLFSYLRVWKIDQYVYINALMPPSESYYHDLFFQVCPP